MISARRSVLWLAPALAWCVSGLVGQDQPAPSGAGPGTGPGTEVQQALRIHYLEIVSADVDATCSALEQAHGVTFGAPIEALGNARTAPLEGGGRVGVRAPMHAAERPVVRPYFLTDDAGTAAGAAEQAGGEIALPPTEIPGKGKFAIYLLAGNELALWQD